MLVASGIDHGLGVASEAPPVPPRSARCTSRAEGEDCVIKDPGSSQLPRSRRVKIWLAIDFLHRVRNGVQELNGLYEVFNLKRGSHATWACPVQATEAFAALSAVP